MSETKLLKAMGEVTEKYRSMGVTVDPKTLAVLVVNHAVGDRRKYHGDDEFWASVEKVESWLTSS